ncbi:hypothetical protein BH23PLA1_BH23PLA1_30300 [soil metagenome]
MNIGSIVLNLLLFIRTTFDIATFMNYTGIDPFNGEEVHVSRHLRDRKLQRALLQFFKPENDFEVREALLKAGRGDLIGNGCDCLIPANPPRAALQARRQRANRDVAEGKYVHTISNVKEPVQKPGSTGGYRPNRRTARRRPRRGAFAAACSCLPLMHMRTL